MSSLATDSVNFEENNSDPRTQAISKITIHHMAGNGNPVYAAKNHLKGGNVSANYYIGSDGKIVSGVSENRRSWCSANGDNDQKAITIEVANNGGEPNWPVSEQAYNSLINLCTDICNRYGFDLSWTGDSNGSLTTHDMFKPTKCPGPYLKERMPNIATQVNQNLQRLKNY